MLFIEGILYKAACTTQTSSSASILWMSSAAWQCFIVYRCGHTLLHLLHIYWSSAEHIDTICSCGYTRPHILNPRYQSLDQCQPPWLLPEPSCSHAVRDIHCGSLCSQCVAIVSIGSVGWGWIGLVHWAQESLCRMRLKPQRLQDIHTNRLCACCSESRWKHCYDFSFL